MPLITFKYFSMGEGPVCLLSVFFTQISSQSGFAAKGSNNVVELEVENLVV